MNQRFQSILGLDQYALDTSPIRVSKLSLECGDQMVLRMLVQSPYSRGLKLPKELDWVRPSLYEATAFQKTVGIRHPYTYITVRSGLVSTHTDDEWHVDGFSTRYTHLPEANYIIVSGSRPTQHLDQTFDFPEDFNPLKHNIHKYFQNRCIPSRIRNLELDTIYFLDPYVIHKRPPATQGTQRIFLRISFTPIEIPDPNNTTNPEIPTDHYIVDGIKEFRDTLGDYHEERK